MKYPINDFTVDPEILFTNNLPHKENVPEDIIELYNDLMNTLT